MKKHIKRLAQSETFTKIVLPIILVVILAIIGFATFRNPEAESNKKISTSEAKAMTEDFINDYLMPSGSLAKVTEVSEEYGLYLIKVDIGTEVVESYLTKDGKLFFPQALDVAEMEATFGNVTNNVPAAPVDLPKNDRPEIELFVMSHCPFGVQMVKAILPTVRALGDTVDFKVKFVDYAMHGEIEIKEQMVQHCIQEEQADKLLSYLECFTVDGETDRCLTAVGVQRPKLEACVAATDKEFKIMENFTNKTDYRGSYPGFNIHTAENTTYGVAGSPTLVINGVQASAPRNPASLLTTICSAFNNEPEECAAQLSSASPAASFGTGTTTNTDAAECY